MAAARLVLFLVLLGSCVQTTTEICGAGVCRAGTLCAPDGVSCVSQTQLDVCSGAVDGAGCSYPGTAEGLCRNLACIPAGCGNGLLEPGELCDDGNRISLDGCRSDCLTLERCGDGAIEPILAETCDCGGAGNTPAICSGPNSAAPGATCRPDCRLAGCGDGTVDPDESCDDGNRTWGDGCRADCLGRFQKMQSPSARNLRAVWTSGPTEAYAVGDAGTVLHFNGIAWSNVDVGITGDIGVVWGSGPNDVYLGVSNGNTVMHYDGTTWRSVTTGVNSTISGIWGSGPSDVYVVGGTGSSHYDGATWTLTPNCLGLAPQAKAVWGMSATKVFIAGSQICRLEGTTWSSANGQPHYGLTGTSANQIYAMKAHPSGTGGQIERWDGGTAWTVLSAPGVIDAFGAAGTELLAVGDNGIILSFDGTQWSSLISPIEQRLRAVAATDGSNIFAVGENGTILH